MDLFQR